MTTSSAHDSGKVSRTLYGLNQSPWTERARWALDHHRIAYDYHEHVPMIGELLLRRKARVAKASVPLLAEGPPNETIVMGSLEIAKHADQQADKTLFPTDKNDTIDHWADIADRLTRVGRTRVLHRLCESRDALKESVPSFVPGALRSMMAPSAGMAIKFLAKKYETNPATIDEQIDQVVRPLLEETRAALKENNKYLVGDSFTFADMALASTLHSVKPRESSNLGPATREAWTNESLAHAFSDLLAWRDEIYAKHRS